jgi:hypothetical protein
MALSYYECLQSPGNGILPRLYTRGSDFGDPNPSHWDTKNDHLRAVSDPSALSSPEFEFLSRSLLAKMYFTAFVLAALPLLVDASLSRKAGLSIPLSTRKHSALRDAHGVVDVAKIHADIQRTVAFVQLVSSYGRPLITLPAQKI